MPTLHAFFVAINHYPNPRHRLKGCLNDMRDIKTYITEHFRKKGADINTLTLVDAEANRDNLIQGFTHFDAAVDDDLCLFFFAGHGARSLAPEAFWHLDPDRKNEALVCYDSRQPGGRDLMDKEISYLIWKATRDKEIHFLVVTDCCHSGSITRLMEESRIRQVEGSKLAPLITDYLGFESYTKVGENRYSPPRGRYVHLSACRKNQTAKEVRINDEVRDIKGEVRGIFSYALLETLQNSQSFISYAELIGRTDIRVSTKFGNQRPQIEATRPLDKNLFFLSGFVSPNKGEYLLSYDQALGWVIHAGAIHGFEGGSPANPTILRLINKEHYIFVTEVLPNRSKISGMENFETKSVYKARIAKRGGKRYLLAFNPDCEANGKTILKAIIAQEASDIIEMTLDTSKALYILHAQANSFFITNPYSRRLLFKKIEGYTEKNTRIFLQNIKKTFRWIQVIELSNPATKIQDDEIQIEFSRITDLRNEAGDATAERVDWRTPPELSYLFDEQRWRNPAFQLKVKNTGLRRLWVSLLYLGDDYSITNLLIPKEELKPGREIWALNVFNGRANRSILVQLSKSYHSWGITSVWEHLRLMICTEEFDTGLFNQEGLEFERLESATRADRSPMPESRADWSVKKIAFIIHRPLEAVMLRPRKIIRLFSLQLEAPAGFQAEVSLNTLIKATEAFSSPLDINFLSEKLLRTFELGPLESWPDLCVLEFFKAQGWPKVTIDNPLKVFFSERERDFSNIQLYGYLVETNHWQALTFEIIESILLIQQLPAPTPSAYSGLGDSIKVFFLEGAR